MEKNMVSSPGKDSLGFPTERDGLHFAADDPALGLVDFDLNLFPLILSSLPSSGM